jgi:hypothetical protein
MIIMMSDNNEKNDNRNDNQYINIIIIIGFGKMMTYQKTSDC